MSDVLQDDVSAVLRLASPDPEPTLAEMAAHGDERGFPTIGPAAGRALRLVSSLVDANRIFEFGSGFGYSAGWFLGALSPAGEIVLTDYDADNLAEAESFLERLPYEATVHYEPGDAMETFDTYNGPFDVVLIDHDKESYVGALEKALPQVTPGGVIIADNMLAGPTTPADVRSALEGGAVEGPTAGIADYLAHVRDETALTSALLPLGEGQLVSRKPTPTD
jgi:caffeoyl-CoA O-methyltransferase